MVVLAVVLTVRGPGLSSVLETKRKLIPLISTSSTKTFLDKGIILAWKYRIVPFVVTVAVFSPGIKLVGAKWRY